MLRVAHTHAAAVVQADPGRAAGDIEHRVEQRPVGYGVAAVLHGLGFAVGRGDAATVQMVATDHHRRLELAVANHLVERQAQLVAQAKAHPADTRRQALKVDPLACHIEPVVQVGVVGNQLLDLGVGLVDVLGIAAQRHPAERPDAFAEQRAHVRRHETGKVEGVLAAVVERHLADVVAVIKSRDALGVERQHCLDVLAHGMHRRIADTDGRVLLTLVPLLHRQPDRQVAVHGVMGTGLVGNRIRAHAPADKLRKDNGRIAQQGDRLGFPCSGVLGDPRQCIVQIGRLLVDIPGAQAHLDTALLALDVEAARTGQTRGQWLRAAHAAEPGSQDPATLETAAIVLSPHLHKGLVGALHDALTADVDPAAGGHLAVHHQALAIELVEVFPVGPVRH